MTFNRRITWAMVCLVLLAGIMNLSVIFPGNRLHKVHPLLLKMAAEAPEQGVAVIVVKADSSGQAEELVTGLGGRIIRELQMVNAFSAELAASAALELADSQAVRWVFLDATVKTYGGNGG